MNFTVFIKYSSKSTHFVLSNVRGGEKRTRNLPSESREGSNKPLLPNSARAKHPPCQELSVSWKLYQKRERLIFYNMFSKEESYAMPSYCSSNQDTRPSSKGKTEVTTPPPPSNTPFCKPVVDQCLNTGIIQI